MDINRLQTDAQYCNHLLSTLVKFFNSENKETKCIHEIFTTENSWIQISYHDDSDEFEDGFIYPDDGNEHPFPERNIYSESKISSGYWTSFNITYSFIIMGKLKTGNVSCTTNEEDETKYEFTFYLTDTETDLIMFSPFTFDENDYRGFNAELNQVINDWFSAAVVIDKTVIDNEMSKYVLQNS